MAYNFQEDFANIKHKVRQPTREDMYFNPTGNSANWQPDPDEEPLPRLNFERSNLQWFDLDLLEPDQLMVLVLRGAMYGVRRVDEENVKLWCSRGGIHKRTVPLLGKLANFGTVDTKGMKYPSREVDFYPRIVAVVSDDLLAHIAMPYFEFDEEGKLQDPKTVWLGSVQEIELGKLPQQ